MVPALATSTTSVRVREDIVGAPPTVGMPEGMRRADVAGEGVAARGWEHAERRRPRGRLTEHQIGTFERDESPERAEGVPTVVGERARAHPEVPVFRITRYSMMLPDSSVKVGFPVVAGIVSTPNTSIVPVLPYAPFALSKNQSARADLQSCRRWRGRRRTVGVPHPPHNAVLCSVPALETAAHPAEFHPYRTRTERRSAFTSAPVARFTIAAPRPPRDSVCTPVAPPTKVRRG